MTKHVFIGILNLVIGIIFLADSETIDFSKALIMSLNFFVAGANFSLAFVRLQEYY